MKKQFIAVLFSVCVVLFWATGVAAELTPKEFTEQFLKAFVEKDSEKIAQLVLQNPDAAKQAQQVLEKAGEGDDDNAKVSKSMSNILSGILQIIQKEDDPNIAEMDRLNEEGLKACDEARYQEALEKWNKGLELAKKVGNKKYISQFIGNIGVVYQNLGQYDKALEYYQQTLEIHKEIRDRRGEGADLTNIGVVYWNLGQYDKALGYYQQALEIKREIRDRRGEGSDLTNIGVVYGNLGQYDKALGYFQQALAIRREIRDRRGEGSDLTNIGVVYDELGEYEKALSYHEQAIAIDREIKDRKGEGAGLLNIGAAQGDLGQYEKAAESFNKSMVISSEIGALDPLWSAQGGLAKTEAKLEKYDAAVKHYEKSLDTLETVRGGISESETKISFMKDKIYVYDEFIELLQFLHQKHPSKGYDKKAFETFERKQGRIFVEEMGKSGARLFADFPEEKRQLEANLIAGLAKTRSDLTQEKSKPEKDRNMKIIRELEAKIEKIKTEQETLEKEIQANYPNYYAIRYPQPVKLDDLRKNVLNPGETMLIYNVMKETTCLWLVSKEDFEFFPLNLTEAEIREKVNQFGEEPEKVRKSIDKKEPLFFVKKTAQKSLPDLLRKSHELYNLLIPENARSLIAQATTLYVIPTGALYDLPFEALVTETSGHITEKSGQFVETSGQPQGKLGQPQGKLEQPQGKSGQPQGVAPTDYLIEKFPVAYLSSASLLKIIRDSQARKKEKAKYPLLAFAHPVYKSPEIQNNGSESEFRNLRTRAYLNIMGEPVFTEMPETEAEAKAIMAILNPPPESDPLQLRDRASKSNVADFHIDKRLDDYEYILFSCHGIIPYEVKYLEQPALVLSHPDPKTQEEGYLKMADVFGIQFNAKLITLSACNTGRGKMQKGEGVIGLTRSFMYAGTPAVSITLWSVESESAKTLSTGFFQNLESEKMNRSEALRQIKLDMIQGKKDELYQHPFFWSPIVVFGDGM